MNRVSFEGNKRTISNSSLKMIMSLFFCVIYVYFSVPRKDHFVVVCERTKVQRRKEFPLTTLALRSKLEWANFIEIQIWLYKFHN